MHCVKCPHVFQGSDESSQEEPEVEEEEPAPEAKTPKTKAQVSKHFFSPSYVHENLSFSTVIVTLVAS